MNPNKVKKLVAGGLALMFIATVLYVSFGTGDNYETGSANINDLLKVRSVFNEPSGDVLFVASDSDPFYALMATPIAAHYTNGDNLTIRPLLVYQGDAGTDRYWYTDASTAVTKFMSNYDVYNSSAVIIGDVAHNELDVRLWAKPFDDDAKKVSLELAEEFWTQSDAVILIENSKWGYAEAVNTVPLASYLSIPVIVADEMNDNIASTLKDLGVKYSIVCGGIGGYGKTLRHKAPLDELTKMTNKGADDNEKVSSDWIKNNMDDIIVQRALADYHQPRIADDTITVLEERMGVTIDYVTIANPEDAYAKELVMKDGKPEEVVYQFSDRILDSGATAYPGAAPSGNDGPKHFFDIPYTYANVIVDMRMDVSEAVGASVRLRENVLYEPIPLEDNADSSGERMYAFIGMDLNGDGTLDTASDEAQFFGGTPGWDMERSGPSPKDKPMWATFRIELPFYNEPMEEHIIQLLGRLPSDPDTSADYELTITVQNLSEPTYPLMHGLSSMAPYLTAYHKGVVLSKEKYQVHTPGFVGCLSCGSPASNKNNTLAANNETKEVKKDLNSLLARIGKVENDPYALQEHYGTLALNPDTVQYLAIMADPNMVPMYFYPSKGQGDATEGYGIPSDIAYQDIDADLEDPPYNIDGDEPSFELAAGRVVGWDVQDVSALVARTVFYDRIIEDYRGPMNFEGYGSNIAPLWKDSGVTTVGSEPPIASAFPTAEKISLMFESAGLDSNRNDRSIKDNLGNEYSRRQYSAPYYESANLLFFCAHGFYYWYVPTAQEGHLGVIPAYSGGGAFDVAHVKDFSMGPGVIFGSSCVTGKIDGIPGRNALSQAFLHAGTNAYVGATRMSWGSLIPVPDEASGERLGNLMGLYFYADLTGYIWDKSTGNTNEFSHTSTGFALMNAKNRYILSEGNDNGGSNSDTFEEFALHGDPAFVPYIPSPA